MKVIRSFIIGSCVFFEGMEGFVPHDKDELCIVTDYPAFFGDGAYITINGKDLILFEDIDKDGFVADLYKRNRPIAAGKFLVPEFVDYIGFTIEELKKLQPFFERIDEKHQYQLLIYKAYIENNGFYLTEEQRMKAFENYKNKR